MSRPLDSDKTVPADWEKRVRRLELSAPAFSSAVFEIVSACSKFPEFNDDLDIIIAARDNLDAAINTLLSKLNYVSSALADGEKAVREIIADANSDAEKNMRETRKNYGTKNTTI